MTTLAGSTVRVAIVQESIDTRRGGAEASVLEMAAALAAGGVAPTILFNTGPDGAAELPTQNGVSFHGLTPPRGMTRSGLARWYVDAISSFLDQSPFDIVHAVTPHPRADVYQPRGGTLAETVARSIARGRTPLSRMFKRIGRLFHAKQRFLDQLERSLLDRTANGGAENPPPIHGPIVAAVSDYVRRQVVERHPNMREYVRVIFNGVNVERLHCDNPAELRGAARAQLGIGNTERIVLFVAHNFKLKGLPELIRARAVVANNATPWKLLVAGRDDARPHERAATALGIDRHIRFIGADHAMRGLYAAADVLAHPTWYDPCSRVVLEALCCGLPVVTTRWNGAAEAMTPGRHGSVVDSPDDVDAIARGVDAALREECGAACVADAAQFRERLSMTRHARELMELYRSILTSRTA